MVNLSTKENALQSDRVPVYMGSNRLYLKKGIQTSNRTIDVPSDVVQEQGNRLNRGTWIQPAQLTVSMEDLSVDMDMEQMLADDWATVNGTITQVPIAGASGLVSQSEFVSGGIVIYAVGQSDKVNCIVLSYHSGASGALRVGEGAPITSVVASNIVTVNASYVTNFSVGDVVLLQANYGAVNRTTASVSRISGSIITLATTYTASSYATSGFIFVNDNYPVSSAKFYDGKPNTTVKGVEVYCYNSTSVTIVSAAGKAAVGYVLLSATGTSVEIDTDGWRDSAVDIVMLYNDHDSDLLFTRYIQDAGLTSFGYNFTGDGFATQTYEFNSSKGMDFAGYILRKSFVINIGEITAGVYDIDASTSFVFDGSEAPIAITQSTSINENTFDQYFTKLTTINSTGTRVIWSEVSASPANKQYSYNSTSSIITFGSGTQAPPVATDRVEITFLCAAANVASGSEYQFDSTAFDHNGTPTAVTGQYQPLTINSSDFGDRIDGLESTTFSITFTRDFQTSQGILAPKIKTSQVGSVEGSFTTREGYNKTMSVITQSGQNGGYVDLAANTQIDVNKSSKYTNNNTIPLSVRLYDPFDNITIVKTIRLPDIQVTNISNSNGVGDDSSFDVTFTGKEGRVLIGR